MIDPDGIQFNMLSTESQQQIYKDHRHVCMTVRFERANITIADENYIYDASVYVRRLNRKSPYYLNMFGDLRQVWANNLTVDIIFNQFLHNEYRRSFIEMHYKLCDFINDEPYMGGMIKMAGLSCPLRSGHHELVNMTAPTQNFPNVFPFEKGRVDATVSLTATKQPVFAFYVEASFKQK